MATARLVAVALLSAATLSFEILLVRVFAIEQFHHFASMAIGVAMLGYGASGAAVAWLRPAAASRENAFVAATMAAAGLFLAAPVAAGAVTLDVTQLALRPAEWGRLAVLYAILALPFGAAALAIVLALASETARPGRVYGSSFVGAGVGAALAVVVLFAVDPVRATALPGLLAAVAALAASRGRVLRLRAVASGLLAAAAIGLAFPVGSLRITPYKGLPQVEAYPEARRVAEASHPVGWVVAVDAPAFRHAPGLSLAYRGRFPPQTALFVDGQLAGAATSWDAETAALLAWLPAAIPHAVAPRRRVLVIGAGEGIEVDVARRHGAEHVTALELHPALVALQGRVSWPADAGGARRVEWVVADARGYVARTGAAFDLITLGPAGGFGAGGGGIHSLNEDFLHTEEAYRAYLARLRPGGVLAVTRWLDVPPRASTRVILTAGRALGALAPIARERALAVVRSWGTVTTVVKPDGFSADEWATLQTWCRSRRFDIDWPGAGAPAPAVFNRIGEPVLTRAATAAVAGGEAERAFTREFPFRVAPVSDTRPYPHHFLDLRATRRLLASSRGDWLPFAEWGTVALAATLIQAVVLAALLVIAPVALRARLPSRFRRAGAYFSLLGFAYLAAEMAAIPPIVLLLGHPVYAVAAVLAGVLVCSGAGSLWSDRRGVASAAAATAVLAGLLALHALGLLRGVHALQAQPLLARVAAAFLLVAPAAFLMGVPFAVGLRAFAVGDPARVAWAWALNGFASVVTAPVAALVALEVGTPVLVGTAAVAYLGAAALLRGESSRVG